VVKFLRAHRSIWAKLVVWCLTLFPHLSKQTEIVETTTVVYDRNIYCSYG